MNRLLAFILSLCLWMSAQAADPSPTPVVDVVTTEAVTTTADTTDSTGRDPTISKNVMSTNVGGLTISVASPDNKQGLSSAVTLLLMMTVLSVAPAFLMMMTSFTRIIIVLGFLRRALGTQTLPPNQVMVGLALFLTLFIMAPTINRINDQAVQPYLQDQITQNIAFDRAKSAVRDFMAKQTRKNDLALFIKLAKEERPRSIEDVSFMTLVPAFLTSELKTAFQMGFIICLPFLVIDFVVSSVLMALGMMMLPPVVVSLPFKILLFILVDGWTLLMQSLVASYGG